MGRLGVFKETFVQSQSCDGPIENSAADTHVDFANAFVGGACMTGDAAQEEMLFLMKPELMIAMATQHRMVDEESICISGIPVF